MKIINLLLVIILLLLVRKLAWCIRWLWCYYHGREVPDPISFLPQQSGRIFAHHVQNASKEEDKSILDEVGEWRDRKKTAAEGASHDL